MNISIHSVERVGCRKNSGNQHAAKMASFWGAEFQRLEKEAASVAAAVDSATEDYVEARVLYALAKPGTAAESRHYADVCHYASEELEFSRTYQAVREALDEARESYNLWLENSLARV
jgi:hypothetical protein